MQQTVAAVQSTGTYGFNAGVQLDIDASKSTSKNNSTTAQASNLSGHNILIQTGTADSEGKLNREGTDTTIKGSHLATSNQIDIQTGELNLLNSTDTTEQKNENEHGHITAQMTVYGASGGASVSGSFDRSKDSNTTSTVNNTTLNADKINLSTLGDANLRGANVHADSALIADVGGDLNVESQQNRSRSKNNSAGISGGMGFGGDGKATSVNGGINASNGMSLTRETVLTSLTSGGTADINVKGNTQITGALIATIDAEGKDTNNLNLQTGSLSFTDLRNTNVSKQTGTGVSTNLSISDNAKSTDPNAANTATTADGDQLRAQTSNLTYSNTQSNSGSKTLATLGHGNITVGGTEQERNGELTDAGKASNSPLILLNRDTSNTEKTLWNSEQSQTVDATLDHRLVTKEGLKDIKNDIDTLQESAAKTYDVIDHKFDGYVDRQIVKIEDKMVEGWRAAGMTEPEIAEQLALSREAGFAENLANLNNDIHNAGGAEALLRKQPTGSGSPDKTTENNTANTNDNADKNNITDVNGVAEMLITGDKDRSLGSQVANFNADTYNWVESLDPDKKAKVETGIQMATGGIFKYAMSEVANQAIATVAPDSVKQTLAQAGETIQREVGKTETALLINVDRDHIDTTIADNNIQVQDQANGNAWMTGMIVGSVSGIVGGKKTTESHINITKDVDKGCKGNWCKELNRPGPNQTIKVDDNYTFHTDAQGRTAKVEGTLNLTVAERNEYQQRKSGKSGLAEDEGGHLIASIFNGPGEKINLVPMNGNLNKGEWKKMENEWSAALKLNQEVKVTVEPVYAGASSRPTSFNITYQINNGEITEKTFKNSPSGI